jgi:hypothetical protein
MISIPPLDGAAKVVASALFTAIISRLQKGATHYKTFKQTLLGAKLRMLTKTHQDYLY